MRNPDHRLVQILVSEEIERIVAEASHEKRRLLRAGEHAFRLAKAYPNSGMNGRQLVDRIVAVAAAAGIPVEISAPKSAVPEFSDPASARLGMGVIAAPPVEPRRAAAAAAHPR